ncbi:MAG: glycosyltransferase family 92 protein [Sphingobacteriales bacterium]
MYRKLFSGLVTYQIEVAICCIVKDEPYLYEWVEYHAAIGVTQFYIYDNGSTTPVNETLERFINSDLVKVVSFSGIEMQLRAYEHCLEHYGPLCKWIAFIDADEFIVPKTLTGNLPDFLKAYKDYGGLVINWLVFGSNGHINKPPGTQVQNYTRRGLKSNAVNEHVKSIVQPSFVIKPLTPHHFNYKKGKYGVNENFDSTAGPFSSHSSNKIQINHYFLRSEADFIQKSERGRADTNEEKHQRTMDDFYETDRNANLIVDESILEVQLFIEQLKTGVKQVSLTQFKDGIDFNFQDIYKNV